MHLYGLKYISFKIAPYLSLHIFLPRDYYHSILFLMMSHVTHPEIIFSILQAGLFISEDEVAKFASTQGHVHPFVIIHKA